MALPSISIYRGLADCHAECDRRTPILCVPGKDGAGCKNLLESWERGDGGEDLGRYATGIICVPPSREKITICCYQRCALSSEVGTVSKYAASSKGHNNLKHCGQTVVFKNTAFGHGECWYDWIVSSVK